jgi:hypothetical protein
MTQSELNRAVARMTGEDQETIACRGFSLVDADAPLVEDDLELLIVDGDQLQAERNTAMLAPRGLATVA